MLFRSILTASASRKSIKSNQPRATSLTELHRVTSEIRKKMEERSPQPRTVEILRDASPINQKMFFEPAKVLRHHERSNPNVDMKRITVKGPKKFDD